MWRREEKSALGVALARFLLGVVLNTKGTDDVQMLQQMFNDLCQ